jgi:hypothetical protein
MRGFIDLKDRRGALRRVIAPMAGAGLLALLLIASGPAASAGSGNGSVKIHVQPTSGPPGTLIKVQGSGFGRICGIGISFTDSAGTVTQLGSVSGKPSFHVRETIPSGAAIGSGTVSAGQLTWNTILRTCYFPGHTATAPFVVTPA